MLAKLSDGVAFKVGPSITQELGQCSEDREVTLPQKLINSLHSLIRGHVCHDVLHKMVAKDQKAHHMLGLIQLHHCLDEGKVNMQQLQRYGNNDQSQWGFGMNAFMLDASLTAANCPLHLSGHAGPPEPVI